MSDNTAKEEFLSEVLREMQSQDLRISPGFVWLYIQDHYEQEYKRQEALYGDIEESVRQWKEQQRDV